MILKCNITKSYDDFKCQGKFSLDNELLVFQGPSGSGKTTILHSIAGLVTPDTGKIQLYDEILFDSEEKINIKMKDRQISTVFQSYNLFPHLTLKENAFFNVKETEESLENFHHLAKILHIDGILNQYPSETSGGQQQRATLLRALMHTPRLLLLDEPFSALDQELKDSLYEEIEIIRAETNLPMILITHNKEEAFRLADRILYLENGNIIGEELIKA